MATDLTSKERKLLTILADAKEPISREALMKKLKMKRGFAKLVGAFTKADLGVQEGNSLGKRGLIKAVSTNPLKFVITAKGRNSIARPRDRPPANSGLSPEDASADEPTQEPFVATEGDSRQIAFRQIKERRGQSAFRNALRHRYGDVCLISRCTELHVLEAAHIKPYLGQPDHHPENGLLLRADLHTLFDLDKIGIEPETLTIHVHPSIMAPLYRKLDGKTLQCARNRPSEIALRSRWESYSQSLDAGSVLRERRS